MIRFRHKGDFKKTTTFLEKISRVDFAKKLDDLAQQGVEALKQATPVDSSKTANSWSYEIVKNKSGVAIYWKNDNINDGVNIAIILQYGHGTRNGGYVQGIDYINPAIAPFFDRLAERAWKEVLSV